MLALCPGLMGCNAPLSDHQAKISAFYFRDSLRNVTLEDLVKQNFTENFKPYVQSVLLDPAAEHWFLYTLDFKQANFSAAWFLQIDFPNIDEAEVYIAYPSGVHRAGRIGDDVPHSEWPVNTRLPTVPLNNKKQLARHVFFKFAATGQPAVLPVVLLQQSQYVLQQQRDYLWYGLFFGAALAMILYNLLLYLRTRISSHLPYVLYLTSITLLQASITGIGQQFLWPQIEGFTTNFALWLMALTNSAMAVFVSSFLDLLNRQPKAHNILLFIAITSLIPPLFLGFVDYIHVQNTQHAYAILTMLVITIITILQLKRGSRPAVYILISYSVLYCGITLSLLRFNGVLQSSFVTTHLIELAIMIEALVLSLGLADKINELKNKSSALERAARLEHEIFTQKLISAHESEKRRFGSILHDDIGHRVLNMQFQISSLASLASSDTSHSKEEQQGFCKPLDTSNDILQELRYLSQDSHPHLIEQLGLEKALAALMEKALAPHKIEYSYHIDIQSATDTTLQHLYRIVQELLSNTTKHAQASEILLNIRQLDDSSITLLYKDDGVGLAPGYKHTTDGFGMISIRERTGLLGGILDIRTPAADGMHLCISRINASEL